MHAPSPEFTPLELPDIPEPIRRLMDDLAQAGHEALFTGTCVREWLYGRTPGEFEVDTDATRERILELFPRSVPTRPGNAMVPTSRGPVDVSSAVAAGGLAAKLASRDFTIHAMGYDPRNRRLYDPFGGHEDLSKGRLRAVGDASQCLSKDSLRALRAVRLVATLPLDVDEELLRAMKSVANSISRVSPERIRFELSTTLLAPRATDALTLLRRCGLEAQLAPGVAEDAASVVGALPFDLEIRLAGWLRGIEAAGILRRIRFSRELAQRVGRLVRMHPLDHRVDPERPASVHRLLKRAGEKDLSALFSLRLAELTARTHAAEAPDCKAARGTLDALARALEGVREEAFLKERRDELAVDGAFVMSLLDCPPGPIVGRALRHLAERVGEDPGCNTRESLEMHLVRWAQEQSDA